MNLESNIYIINTEIKSDTKLNSRIIGPGENPMLFFKVDNDGKVWNVITPHNIKDVHAAATSVFGPCLVSKLIGSGTFGNVSDPE
jgi:hypothetical protein